MALYLYNLVYLYGLVVNETITAGEDIRDPSRLRARVANKIFLDGIVSLRIFQILILLLLQWKKNCHSFVYYYSEIGGDEIEFGANSFRIGSVIVWCLYPPREYEPCINMNKLSNGSVEQRIYVSIHLESFSINFSAF